MVFLLVLFAIFGAKLLSLCLSFLLPPPLFDKIDNRSAKAAELALSSLRVRLSASNSRSPSSGSITNEFSNFQRSINFRPRAKRGIEEVQSIIKNSSIKRLFKNSSSSATSCSPFSIDRDRAQKGPAFFYSSFTLPSFKLNQDELQ